MLETFRSVTKSKVGAIFAFILLGLIALAFASADVSNTGSFGGVTGGDRAATVGKERIDTSALSQAAATALENVRQQDPRMSMQGFLATGGLEQVLDQMIERLALATFGRENGIVASDRLIDSEIAKVPAFRGPDGKFSDAAFRQMMQQRGVNEKMIRSDLAQGLIARQILLPASFGALAPREMAVRYGALLRETRKGSVALLPSALFTPDKPPTDAELQAFYTAKRDDFIRPERRVIRYASFGDEVLKTVPAPTEAEIAARFNADKAQYAELETRRVTQLIVPTEAAAKAVVAEVSGGKSLEVAAREKGLATADLGTVAKAALAGQSSQAVADAVFAAGSGAIAAPARSGLGWHVMRVDGIDKRPARTLDQVRPAITAALAVEKRRKALSDMSAHIEEQFDNGGNLADAAKDLGLTLQHTAQVTADGQVYEKPTERIPPVLARVLQTAFSMERENQPQLAEVEPGKAFVIFDVTEIAPSAPAPLAEIKRDVETAYMLEKGSAAAKTAADRVQAEVRKGATLQAAMATLGKPLPPVQQVDMNRQQLTQAQQVPPPLMLLFSMAQGTVKALAAPGDRGWFVVSLQSITPAEIRQDDALIAAAQRELGGLSGEEYAEQLQKAIRGEIGVKRNDAAIAAVRKQLVGGN